MSERPSVPNSQKSREACAKNLHRLCGGGIIRGGGKCQCPCHKRRKPKR